MQGAVLTMDYRCTCGKLLFKGSAALVHVETKCKRCGEIVSFSYGAVDDGRVHYWLLASPEGRIVDASSSIASILGFGSEDLISESSEQAVVALHAWAKQANRFPQRCAFECTHIAKGGRLVPVRARSRPFSAAGRHFIMYLCEMLPEGDEHRVSVGVIHECIAEIDRDARFTYANPGFCRFFDKDQAVLLGKDLFDSIADRRGDESRAAFACAVRGRHAFSADLQPEGSEKPLRFTFSPFYGDSGCFGGYVVVLTSGSAQ